MNLVAKKVKLPANRQAVNLLVLVAKKPRLNYYTLSHCPRPPNFPRAVFYLAAKWATFAPRGSRNGISHKAILWAPQHVRPKGRRQWFQGRCGRKERRRKKKKGRRRKEGGRNGVRGGAPRKIFLFLKTRFYPLSRPRLGILVSVLESTHRDPPPGEV